MRNKDFPIESVMDRRLPERGREDRPSLYRREAFCIHTELRLGRPVALLPSSWGVLTILLFVIVVAAIVFLSTATYSRKETVRGALRPVGGDLRIIARSSGLVRSLMVSEGALVRRGAPLVFVSTARQLESDDGLLASLNQERDALRSRLIAFDAATSLDDQAIAAQLSSLEQERDAARGEYEASAERQRIAEDHFESGRAIHARGFITRDEIGRLEDAVIVQRQAAISARGRQLSLTSRITELRARRAQRPYSLAQERAQIEAQVASIAQRLAQYEAERGYTLRAPITGRVTALQVTHGQAVDSQRPMMTISPVDTQARLMAELYVPSRAIGFVKPGQRVRLLYDAFPYQRFGPATGIVAAVSASVLSPQELLAAANVAEPVYRVLVTVDHATISAFGQPTALQAGMALSADIILETRNLATWLFEPVAAMRGRM